jgi:hypothetical protein
MKRKALVVVTLAVIAAGAAYSLASGGNGDTVAPALVVSSVPVSASSAVTLRFRAAAASGRQGTLLVDYTLSVAGPVRSGCVGTQSEALPATREGAVLALRIIPDARGRNWCAGTFTARVTETERPFCAPGTMCPQFIRLIGTVARTSFRVAG